MKSRKIRRTVLFPLVLSCCLTLMCSCGEANSGGTAATQTPQPGKEVTAIILSSETIEITVGDTYQMTYMVLPDGAADQTLAWKSTDEAKVIVDEVGIITAVEEGQANIIVSTENGVYATCKVTVKEPSAYDRLDEDEKELVDALLAGIDKFYDPGSVSLKYAYHHGTGDSWAITVSAQNQMGGYSEKDYNLYEDGRLEEPVFNHVRMPGNYYDLDLVNEAIKECTN